MVVSASSTSTPNGPAPPGGPPPGTAKRPPPASGEQLAELLAELERLRAAVAYHQPVPDVDLPLTVCVLCDGIWPCLTVRVAGGQST